MIEKHGEIQSDTSVDTYLKVKCTETLNRRIIKGNLYMVQQHDVHDAYEVYDLAYNYLDAAYKVRFSEPIYDNPITSIKATIKDFE